MKRNRTLSVAGLAALALTVGALTVGPSSVVGAAATAPRITGISVSRGPLGGGTDVVVVGTGFTKKTTVSFGGTKARNVTRTSSPG